MTTGDEYRNGDCSEITVRGITRWDIGCYILPRKEKTMNHTAGRMRRKEYGLVVSVKVRLEIVRFTRSTGKYVRNW